RRIQRSGLIMWDLGELDGFAGVFTIDRVDEANDPAPQAHEECGGAAPAAPEAHALQQLAVGDAGGGEDDVLAGGQLLGGKDPLRIADAERLEAGSLVVVDGVQAALD